MATSMHLLQQAKSLLSGEITIRLRDMAISLGESHTPGAERQVLDALDRDFPPLREAILRLHKLITQLDAAVTHRRQPAKKVSG